MTVGNCEQHIIWSQLREDGMGGSKVATSYLSTEFSGICLWAKQLLTDLKKSSQVFPPNPAAEHNHKELPFSPLFPVKPFSWWPQVLNLRVLSWTEPVTFYGMNFLKFDHGQTSGWSNSVLPWGLGAYLFLASAQIISISPFICDDLRKRLSSTRLCKVGAKSCNDEEEVACAIWSAG